MTKEEWLDQKDIYTGVTLREAMERHQPFTRYAAANPSSTATLSRDKVLRHKRARQAYINKQIEEMRRAADGKI